MASQRVFEVANEAGADVKTALRVLHELGSDITEPTKRLDIDLTRKLREALGLLPREQVVSVTPQVPLNPRGAGQTPGRPHSHAKPVIRPMPKEILGPNHTNAIKDMIPGLYDSLSRDENLAGDGIVVIYHDARLVPEYGLSTLNRQRWAPAAGSAVTRDELLEPLRLADRAYRDRALMPPNTFIAIDIPNKRVWFSRSLQRRPRGPFLDAVTLQPIPEILDGPPARLASKAQLFLPPHIPGLVQSLTSPNDRPEEAFLLHEELLQLAIDTLHGDEQLDPLPVHIDALWVFSRPVIMRRPDDTERYVRAVWYRQGEVVWRMRAFAAGISKEPKEVGERLSGRLPFVPVWDETRPEQKLLAAVWALMAQGSVTESERRPVGNGITPGIQGLGDLVVVHVKAGTDHAQVYRSDDPSNSLDRPAWSVRGHWRRQPYPSLGRDDDGKVITKMKWIASYSKGDTFGTITPNKVIAVRP